MTGIIDNVFVFDKAAEAHDFIMKKIKAGENAKYKIFLDLNMPVMDGWQFLDIMSSHNGVVSKHTSVVVLSSSIDDYDRKKAMGYSLVTDFISKPLNKKIISMVINGSDHSVA